MAKSFQFGRRKRHTKPRGVHARVQHTTQESQLEENRMPSGKKKRHHKKGRARQLQVARAARGKKKNSATDPTYEEPQTSVSSSDESSGVSLSPRKVKYKERPAKVPKIESIPDYTKSTARSNVTTLPWNVPCKRSIRVRHQKADEADQGSEGSRAPISHLSETDFNSLVDLIKRQRCCSCSGANLLLELHGSSTDTGISPELLTRISQAIS